MRARSERAAGPFLIQRRTAPAPLEHQDTCVRFRVGCAVMRANTALGLCNRTSYTTARSLTSTLVTCYMGLTYPRFSWCPASGTAVLLVSAFTHLSSQLVLYAPGPVQFSITNSNIGLQAVCQTLQPPQPDVLTHLHLPWAPSPSPSTFTFLAGTSKATRMYLAFVLRNLAWPITVPHCAAPSPS